MKIEKLSAPEEFTEKRFGPVFREMAAGIPADLAYPGLNFEHVLREWRRFMDAGFGETWAAVDEDGKTVGGLGAIFLEDFFTGAASGFEQWWFVAKEWRKTGAAMMLFRAFEDRARQRGVKMLWAGTSPFFDPITLGILYERRGFRHWGSNYQKTL